MGVTEQNSPTRHLCPVMFNQNDLKYEKLIMKPIVFQWLQNFGNNKFNNFFPIISSYLLEKGIKKLIKLTQNSPFTSRSLSSEVSASAYMNI